MKVEIINPDGTISTTYSYTLLYFIVSLCAVAFGLGLLIGINV